MKPVRRMHQRWRLIRYLWLGLALVIAPQTFAIDTDDLNALIEEFQQHADGRISYKGIEFDSFGAYTQSLLFRLDGKRCGIENHINTRIGGMVFPMQDTARSVQDCTSALTRIQSEYWPTRITYKIPVWFHVIYNSSGTGNISNTRIQQQIAVLNEDYRAKSGSIGQTGFDVKIQFQLAGVTRTQNNSWFTDSIADEYAYKTALRKDPARYLNIYTNDAAGYLGYATLPQLFAGQITDGIVLNYRVVGGRNNGATSPFNDYDQGRTLVHEIGHYLGLYHTFQDGASCGNSFSSGDLITDTNAESGAFYSCGTRTTCGTPDPTNNYMNYSDDLCMNRFTAQQANRMVCSLVNYRPSLPTVINTGTSTGTNPGAVIPPILKLLLLE